MIVALFKRNLTTWWPIYSFATVYLCAEIETSARHRYVHYLTGTWSALPTTWQTNKQQTCSASDWLDAEEFPWIIYKSMACVCVVAWIVQISRIKEIELNWYEEKCDLGFSKGATSEHVQWINDGRIAAHHTPTLAAPLGIMIMIKMVYSRAFSATYSS